LRPGLGDRAASQSAETAICARSLCNWAKHSFGSWLMAAAHASHRGRREMSAPFGGTTATRQRDPRNDRDTPRRWLWRIPSASQLTIAGLLLCFWSIWLFPMVTRGAQPDRSARLIVQVAAFRIQRRDSNASKAG